MSLPRLSPPRRLAVATVLAAAGTFAAAGVFAPGTAALSPAPDPAPPAAVCSIGVPDGVPVDAPTERVRLALRPDCPVGAWATWDLLDPSGAPVQRVTLTQGTSGVFVIGAGRRYGTYRFVPVTAYAQDFGQIPQNHVSLPVGARSHTATAVRRSGPTVRVDATATSYDRGRDRYVPRPRAVIRLQRASCVRSCPWSEVARTRTDARGRARLTATSPATGAWRTVVTGTDTVWGSVSTPVTR